MSDQFIVNSVSVIAVAEGLKPARLNPDFLLHKDIAEANWVVKETVTTPVLSFVKYENENNRIDFSLEEQRIAIIDSSDSDGFKASYPVHKIAHKFLSSLEGIDIRALGLNCHILLKHLSPEEWLKKFIVLNSWGTSLKTVDLKFTFDCESAILSLSLSPRLVKNRITDETIKAVNFECNFHHHGPFSLAEVEKILDSWPSKQNYLTTKISALVESGAK